jgi:DNA-binding MarR family transcriptional regulator
MSDYVKDQDFKKMVDNILIYYPLFYRKIKTSMSDEKALKYGKSDGYYQILGILINSEPLPISEVGKKLQISKPNMTPLIDKLVKDGFVNRSRSEKDRRIVNIGISKEGRKFLLDAREVVEENIKENLKNLDENDLDILNESLETIRKLIFKIENK